MGAAPPMNRSAKGGTRSSLHYGGEGVLIHPPDQGVCGRHGTEERRVTSGGLAESAGGTGVSRPISESEVASDAPPVDGRLCSTRSAVKTAATEESVTEVGQGRQPAKRIGKKKRTRGARAARWNTESTPATAPATTTTVSASPASISRKDEPTGQTSGVPT